MAWALVVRGRRPGDRMRPIGLGGTKKLQDLLVDRKVPRGERDRIPVVVDASGPDCVGGWAGASPRAPRPSGPQDDVVVLSFERPAGSGSEAS